MARDYIKGGGRTTLTSSTPDRSVAAESIPTARTRYPLGIYYVSHFVGEKSRRLADLPKIAQAGLRYLATPVDNSDTAMMDSCARLGLKVLLEFNDGNDTHAQQVTTWHDHPALGGWQIFDDIQSKTVAQVLAEIAIVRGKDPSPQHLTYTSGSGAASIGPYLDLCDAITAQTYVISAEEVSAVNSIMNNILSVKKPGGSQLWAVNQAFAFPADRYPTPDELKSMTWITLLRGMQGIMFYTYYDPLNDLNLNLTVLAAITELVGLIRLPAAGGQFSIEDFLMRGTRTTITTGNAYIFAAYFRLNKKLLVLATNSHQVDIRSATLQLPSDTQGGDRLALTLNPLQIYSQQFDLA